MLAKWLDRNAMRTPFYTLALNEAEWGQAFDDLELPTEGRPDWVFEGGGRTSVCQTEKGMACVVGMNLDEEDHRTPLAFGLLVHEATHVFQEWMIAIGEETPYAEFMAYSIQHISTELMCSYRHKFDACKDMIDGGDV